ncbi:MAG TPA: hypothetical protein VGM39_02375 [Kofleriaceae bacterium]
MLSPEIDISDLDARHWTNWWRLLSPPRVLESPRWALAILDDGKVIKLVIAGDGARGSIDPDAAPCPGLSAKALEQWAKTLGVAAVVAIERDAIATLAADVEAALRRDQDYIAQGLVALKALKKLAGTRVFTSPPLLELLPAPGFEPIQRTFDLLIPDRSALVAYVIEDDRSRIHSSIIATKEGGDISRVATHRAIADLVPEVSFARDWQKTHERVAAAVEERFAKPSLAIFGERKTLLDVLTGPSDQLAREINAKRIVIDPAPTWLLGLLGGAAMAAMAGRAARGLASLLPQSARDRASALVDRAKTVAKDAGPWAPLGFDPLELWAQLRHFYRR